MSRPTLRTEKLDMETVSLIKALCAEYGIMRSIYYEHSELGAPGEGQLSYMSLLAAMGGGNVTPEQDGRIARSVSQVRAALRASGRLPLRKQVLSQLTAALAAWEEDPDVFVPGELSALRRIASRAVGRIDKKRT